MFLGSLRVAHLPKRALPGTEFETTLALLDPLFPGAFRLETCQRTLWVYPSFLVAKIPTDPERSLPHGLELLEGATAYGFLLEVATGLQSEVRGETDVYGQMKEAWAKYEASSEGSVLSALRPWLVKLFEDTREIRAQYLQNVGAGSYGSLVRKLHRARFSLNDDAIARVNPASTPQRGEPVLLVGAGQIAESIAPWLAEGEIWLWNRSREKLHRLAAEVAHKLPHCRIVTLETEEALLSALARVPSAVFAIPPDAEKDPARLSAWRSNEATQPRFLCHLGGMRAALTGWAGAHELVTLDDLFSLQKVQEASRAEQFARAEKACREKAGLRALSEAGSVTLPHGWEDLAAFA